MTSPCRKRKCPTRSSTWQRNLLVLLVLCGGSSSLLRAAETAPGLATIAAPAAELRARLHLKPFYAKHLNCGGLAILSSAKVSDYALREAEYLVRHELQGRDDLLRAISQADIRLAVMAPSEFTTDIPEHSDLTPASYWNRRARGLGATKERPAVSCGEENLLCLAGDPHPTENILIHEFAHVIHEIGLAAVDPTFDARLQHAFSEAKASGRWRDHYALTNHQEYWAEGVQSWFACNRPTDPVNDRATLTTYDPPLAALLGEVFVGNPWVYVRPDQRMPPSPHLAGFERITAATFVWPADLGEALKK
jgi:hypothetical protein